jgi:hypothetical protein
MTTGAHCIDCKANHVCGAYQNSINSIIAFSQRPERSELNPSQLGQELKLIREAIKMLEGREISLSAQGESFIRSGQRVPFFHMEQTQSRLTYFDNVETDELVSLSDLIGVDIRKKLKRSDQIVTPTQAIDLGVDPSVMKHYANRPPGKMKLTADNPTEAKKVFSK